MKPIAIRIVKTPSLLALLGTLGCLTVASAQYATDFESPDFTAGATINGQDFWTSTTPDRARILTAAQIADELTALGMTPGPGPSGAAGQSETSPAVCVGGLAGP